uniref:Uncharacterized protein n=1 Tax=Rhinopithecus bieti TaxID=61621 RepID=A0A2K6LE58_RHIBE
MASQNTEQEYEDKLAPSVGGEPTSGGDPFSSPDPNPDSSEVLYRHEDHAVSQDPGSQVNSPPEDRNQCVVNTEDNHNLLLWGCSLISKSMLFIYYCHAVEHNHTWEERNKQFIPELLKCFILFQIYCNSNFQRDMPRLLENIQTKDDFRNTAQQARKKLVPIRHSPRFHHNNAMKEANNIQGPSDTQSFLSPGMCSMNSITGHSLGSGPPQKPNDPSGEGTSEDVTFASLTTCTGMESTGKVPSTLVYPDYDCVMSLYNTRYSILSVAISVMSPDEPPDEE